MKFTVKQVSLIAGACAAAFAAPAVMAQRTMPLDGNALTIKGSIGGGLGRVKSSGATAGPASDTVARTVVTPGDNEITFFGSTKLNGPLIKAFGFTMETGFDTDEGFSGASAGILFARNTGMGMRTDIGDFWTGKWDSPFKGIGGMAAVTGTASGVSASTTSILRSPGMGFSGGGTLKGGTAGGNTMGFDRRQTNTLNYASPVFSNTRVLLQFSPDEETGTGSPPASSARARMYGLGVIYKSGPLTLGYAYDRHDDFLWGATATGTTSTFALSGTDAFGIASGPWGQGTESKDTGHLVVVNYKFGNTTLKAYYDRLRWTQSGGTAILTELEKDDWYIGVQQQLGGPHGIRV